MKIAIFGSCVTRDAFGIHPDRLERPDRYFARSALASALCPTPFTGVDTSVITSDFQRTVVQLDLDKAFEPWLRSADADLILLDGIDERFGIYVDDGGAIATRSSEFMSTKPDTSKWTLVAPNTDEYYDRWVAAWERFVETAGAAGVLDRVRVNQVRWADTFDAPGATFPDYYSPQRIRRSNAFLDRIHARMAVDLPDGQFYRYADHELLAAADHQWGTAPFHYTPSFYRRFVEHVTGLPVVPPRRSLRSRLRRRGQPGGDDNVPA